MTNLDSATKNSNESGTTFYYDRKPYTGIYEKETNKLFVSKQVLSTEPIVGNIIEIDGGIPKISSIATDHSNTHYILQLK